MCKLETNKITTGVHLSISHHKMDSLHETDTTIINISKLFGLIVLVIKFSLCGIGTDDLVIDGIITPVFS